MKSMTKVKIKTPKYPTESKKKIKKAINQLFPEIELETINKKEKQIIKGTGTKEDLETLREKILEQKISDTARKILLKNNFIFSLNKQAATEGKVNFKQEKAPLGTIDIEIETNKELINWLAPETKDGEPI